MKNRSIFYLIPLVFLISGVAIAATFTSYQTGNWTDSSTWEGPTDYSTFPVLVSETITDLKTTTHGGKVTNANGYDIIFASDSGCTTKLNFEIETYASTTGQLVAWLNVPTLNSTTDTTFYLCYASTTVSTDQSNKNAVWDANYKLVDHLNSTSTLSAMDSTSNNNHGTITTPTGTSGKIDGGANFNGTSDYIGLPDSVTDFSGAFTISAWVNFADVSGYNAIISKDQVSSNFAFVLFVRDGVVKMGSKKNSTGSTTQGGVITAGGWHHIVATVDATTNASIYIDGNNSTVFNYLPLSDRNDLGTLKIGYVSQDPFWNGIEGKVDEVQISNSVRSSSWIATEYNNQSSPSTFYSAGSEVSGGIAYVYKRLITVDHTKVANTVPSSIHDAVITSGKTLTVPSRSSVIARSVIINSGGILTQGTDSLIIYYRSFINNGTLNQSSGAQIKQALLPELQSSTDDNTPTFNIYCATGSIVELLADATAVASGTCINNIVSLTSTSLSFGTHNFTARETNVDGTRYGFIIKTIDSSGDVFNGVSMVLANDGLPIFAYYQGTNNGVTGTLKYAKCTDSTCSSPVISTIDATAANFGYNDISIKLGMDGFARIAYHDEANKRVKYLVCNDINCTIPTISIVDDPASGNAGRYLTLIIDSGGVPFIAYHKGGGSGAGTGKQMLAHYMGSGGTGCTGTSVWTCTEIATGTWTNSMVLGLDGFPRIAYTKQIIIGSDWTGDELHFAVCSNANCTSKTINTVDASSVDVGQAPSVAVGSDGFARISYSDSTNNTLKLARCLDSSCSLKNIIEADPNGQANLTSIVLDPDDNAHILYTIYAFPDIFPLIYLHCNDINCDTSYSIMMDESTTVREYPNLPIVLDQNRFFKVSYNDYTNGILKFASQSFTSVTLSDSSSPSSPTPPPPSGGGIVGSGPDAPSAQGLPGYVKPRPQIVYPDGHVVYLDEGVTPIPTETVNLTVNQSIPEIFKSIPSFTFVILPNKIGKEVKSLQVILNSLGFTLADSGPGSPGNETSKFGALTFKALQKFQCTNGIVCSGRPDTTGYGQVGPKTRAKLNSLIGR